MGLAGAKSRTKLSRDPNNTAWARDESAFGRKMLAKQGWKPGDFLGAQNAGHSQHYTAANASHIRVALREDNLGLGATVGGGRAETFGLSLLSGLLGRLNGQDDGTLQKQDHARHDAELRRYQAHKLGWMNFVSGGLLVGDRMQHPPTSTRPEHTKPPVVAVTVEGEKKHSKKRKASDHETGHADAPGKKREGEKHNKKRKASEHDTGRADALGKKREGEKHSKKRKASEHDTGRADVSGTKREAETRVTKEKTPTSSKDDAAAATTAAKRSNADARGDDNDDGDDEARLKAAKRARHDERRRRKEAKRRRRAGEKESEEEEEAEAEAAAAPAAPIPAPTRAAASDGERRGPSPPPAMVGRQALRQRYIEQKRMASSHAAALKEILMLPPQATAS